MNHQPKDKIDEILDAQIEQGLVRLFQRIVDTLSANRTANGTGRVRKPTISTPAYIYKYIGWAEENSEYVISSLFEQRTIRFTRFTELNDPFEVNPVTRAAIDPAAIEKYLNPKRIRRFLWETCTSKPFTQPRALIAIPFIPLLAQRIYARIPFHQAKLDRIYRGLDQKDLSLSYNYFISCFSEDPMHPLMWAHYAKAHTGIVVGYDATHSYFRSADGRSRLGPVVYSETRPWWGFSERFSMDIGRRKSSHWRYEKEWRATPEQQPLEGNNVMEMVPEDCISDVYLGVRMPAEEKRIVLAKIAAHLPRVRVHQLSLNDDQYSFDTNLVASDEFSSP